MRLSTLTVLATVLIGIGTFAAAQEPQKSPLSPKISTGTRQVTMFTELETQMLRAVQKKDKSALQAMLADGFAIEMPDANRLEGDDWLTSIMGQGFGLKRFGVGQVSFIDLGNAALVKFVRIQEATSNGTSDDGEFFVVDLWNKDGNTWKLANRYVSKVSSQIPPVRPTGKE
jgi:hypothetical protein